MICFRPLVIYQGRNIMSWIELLDGILMSDGNLTIPGQCHFPRYQQTCKEPTFLEWVSSWLPTLSRVTGPHPSGKYQYWLLSTKTNAIYTSAYQHWYPQGKKHLPDDLKITPKLMLTEYLGDGFLHVDAAKKLQHIELGTYGFKEAAVLDLLPKLQQQGLDFRRKSNNALNLRGGRVQSFLDYIGPCPVPALSYKWNCIKVADLMWRKIEIVEKAESLTRHGSVVHITLECGHAFRRPLSRLRSPRTNLMICHVCRSLLKQQMRRNRLTPDASS